VRWRGALADQPGLLVFFAVKIFSDSRLGAIAMEIGEPLGGM